MLRLLSLKGVVLALAMAAPFGFVPARALAAAREPVRFERIEWGSPAARVEQRLERAGYRLRTARPEGGWRYIGRVLGRSVDVVPEYDARASLVAFTIQFHPESQNDALELYAGVVGEMRRRHGEPSAVIEPARPVESEWVGRERRLLRRAEVTAASMWVSPSEDAVAAQLDAQHYVWLRYESRRWAAAHDSTGR